MRIVNASNICMLCGIVDLTTELRCARQYRLPVPICNPCWPKERRALARVRAYRRTQAQERTRRQALAHERAQREAAYAEST